MRARIIARPADGFSVRTRSSDVQIEGVGDAVSRRHRNVKLRKLVAETVTKDAVFGNKAAEVFLAKRGELYRTTLEKYLEIPRVARDFGEDGHDRRRYE